MKSILKLILCALLFLFVIVNISSCATTPPTNRKDICSIFRQYPNWYWAAQDVQKKWGLPINDLMAIMYQESRFNATAKPPRRKILWVIPWFRPTTATGYAQPIEATWRLYKKQTGNYRASRDNFADAADFVGWYTNFASKKLGIPKTNAYDIYLAYHEGTGNYAKGSYKKKAWLMAVAKKVQRYAWMYKTQLIRCQSSLPQKPWWHFW